MIYIFVLWFLFSPVSPRITCGPLRCYIWVLQSNFKGIKIWLDNLNTSSCHMGCISVQWDRSSGPVKDGKSLTGHSPLGVLVFLPLPAQVGPCLASTWLGEGGERDGVRRWARQQVASFLFFSPVSLAVLTRAGKSTANRISTTPVPAVLRQAEARGQGVPYILPFPRGRLSSEASEEAKVKKRIYNPRKKLSSL